MRGEKHCKVVRLWRRPVGEGLTGRGSALLEGLDINGKCFPVPHRAAGWLSMIFLFLLYHKGKTMSEEYQEYFQERTA